MDLGQLAGQNAAPTQEFERDPYKFVNINSNNTGDVMAGSNNLIWVLPSCSTWAQQLAEQQPGETPEAAAARQSEYQIGLYVDQIRIKYGDNKNARTFYNVGRDNPLTKAWWKIHAAYKQNGKFPLGSQIRSEGFAASPDNRRLYNIFVSKDGGQSINPQMKHWILGLNDKGQVEPGKERDAHKLFMAIVEAQQALGGALPFDPTRAVAFQVTYGLNGGAGNPIPVINHIGVARDQNGQPITFDFTTMYPIEQLNEQLDYAATWIEDQKKEALPELSDIPAITNRPELCELLGVATPQTMAQQHGTIGGGIQPGYANITAGVAQQAAAPQQGFVMPGQSVAQQAAAPQQGFVMPGQAVAQPAPQAGLAQPQVAAPVNQMAATPQAALAQQPLGVAQQPGVVQQPGPAAAVNPAAGMVQPDNNSLVNAAAGQGVVPTATAAPQEQAVADAPLGTGAPAVAPTDVTSAISPAAAAQAAQQFSAGNNPNEEF